MQHGIDLVVCSYKTPADLDGFLESLRDNKPSIPWTLTIFNVCPEPEDTRVAMWWRDRMPAATWVLSSAENIGYAGACNRGAYGSYSHIGLFNADVRITEGSLDALVAYLDADSSRAIAGPRQLDERGRFTAAGIFGPREAPKHRGWQEPDSGKYQDNRDDCPTVSGAAFIVKRTVWDELTNCPVFRRASELEGLGEPQGALLKTQHFYEETFCCYHAIEHGYKCCFLGEVTMIHKWHQASPQGSLSTITKESQRRFRTVCDHMGIPHD